MAERESSLAVLVDFENMARPGAKGRGDFDIHLVNNRLAEKGRVLVKRAYADWSRYRDARHELQNAGLGLIEMPSAREGAKNRADIQMAVDAGAPADVEGWLAWLRLPFQFPMIRWAHRHTR